MGACASVRECCHDVQTDTVDEAFELLTELGRHGWDVDCVEAGPQLLLTASKGKASLVRCRSDVVESALELYADARRLDLLRPVEALH